MAEMAKRKATGRHREHIKRVPACARERADNVNPVSLPSLDGLASECVDAHVRLRGDAGLPLIDDTSRNLIGGGIEIVRPTWQGHERPEASRRRNGSVT